MANRTSQFGLGQVVVTYDRHQRVDVTYPPYPFEMTVTTAAPQPLPQTFNLLRPFKLAVWVTILVALSVATTTTIAILYISGLSQKKEAPPCSEVIWRSFRDLYLANVCQGMVCNY